MYFNCYLRDPKVPRRCSRTGRAVPELGVSDRRPYALSATRAGASPQSCSRR
jgi:hypothetical protein